MKKKFLVLTLIFSISLLSISITSTYAQTGTALTLYAGSVTSGSGTYGFGNSADNIVSPGPTLNLQVGTTYTMTVNNAADIPHSWEIVSTKAVSSTPLFGAGIDITSYIAPQSSGTVTFTPDQAGNFYYVCTVPGHIDLGMWGNVVVTSGIPEFPSTLMIVFLAIATTALVAFLAIRKKK